jgi:hypothetical protein
MMTDGEITPKVVRKFENAPRTCRTHASPEHHDRCGQQYSERYSFYRERSTVEPPFTGKFSDTLARFSSASTTVDTVTSAEWPRDNTEFSQRNFLIMSPTWSIKVNIPQSVSVADNFSSFSVNILQSPARCHDHDQLYLFSFFLCETDLDASHGIHSSFLHTVITNLPAIPCAITDTRCAISFKQRRMALYGKISALATR